MRLRQLKDNRIEEIYKNVCKDFNKCSCGRFHSLRNAPEERTLKHQIFLLLEYKWEKAEEKRYVCVGGEKIDDRLLLYADVWSKIKLSNRRN